MGLNPSVLGENLDVMYFATALHLGFGADDLATCLPAHFGNRLVEGLAVPPGDVHFRRSLVLHVLFAQGLFDVKRGCRSWR